MNYEKVLQALKTHLETTGRPQSAVAKSCGLSDATISAWIKGTYAGAIENVTAKIHNYLKLEEDRAKVETHPETVIKTEAFTKASLFCHLVATHNVIGVLTGDAGCGKTTAIKEYVKKYPNVIFIEADKGYNASVLLIEICNTLGLDERGDLHAKLTRIVNKLKDSGRTIFVDEAEHLPYRALELIRRIYDKAGVGIALCGMPRLLKNLVGDKNYYAQLYSRVSIKYGLNRLTNKDVESYLKSRFESYDEKCTQIALKESRGNLRSLSHIIRWSIETMRYNNLNTLSPGAMARAIEMMMVA
jgi:DNA transposition AAA+ family ATPase